MCVQPLQTFLWWKRDGVVVFDGIEAQRAPRRIVAFKNPVDQAGGAGEGNRTLVFSLEGCVEPYINQWLSYLMALVWLTETDREGERPDLGQGSAESVLWQRNPSPIFTLASDRMQQRI
jgi:hypothetical protein